MTCLDKRRDDGLVVHDVVVRQCAALAVLEPLLRRLISADVEVPCRFRNIVEVLLGVDVDSAILPFHCLNLAAPCDGEVGVG